MIHKFKFDYDPENDSLFMYDEQVKSKASVAMDNLVFDYDSKKNLCGIELLQASEFFADIDDSFKTKLNKDTLKELTECEVKINVKNNFSVVTFYFTLSSNEKIVAPMFIPTIDHPSPALSI